MKPLMGSLLLLISVLASAEPTLSERLSRPAYEDLGADQHLTPLFTGPASMGQWNEKRVALLKQWEQILGQPSFKPGYEKAAKVISTFDQPEFRGTILRQPTGPDTQQLVLLMEPLTKASGPRPGAVVPFYNPDAMAGFDLNKRARITTKQSTQFGRHLVQQGYVVVCTEAFPYNIIPAATKRGGLSEWHLAARQLLQDHPHWTGMGKLVHDTRRAIDLLLEQPSVDPKRVVLIGHSLGGKMAFYTGCLDDRVRATIATDFGIGWTFTNWKDPWYLGSQITDPDFPLAHHQLLALHAPRSFLLVAGQYDKPESWQYLQAAQAVYQLHQKPHALGMIDHASGHQPTEAAMRSAYTWLAEQIDWQPGDWKF